MPTSCSVFGCTNRHKKGSGVNFYRFPSAKHQLQRRLKWIHAVKRIRVDGKEWMPTTCSYVCSAHFQTGKPSRFSWHPDFVPTLGLFKYDRSNGSVQGQHFLKLQSFNLAKTHDSTVNPVSKALEKPFSVEEEDSNCVVTYSKSKPHVCNICNKVFVKESNLTSHICPITKSFLQCCPDISTEDVAMADNTEHEMCSEAKINLRFCKICKKALSEENCSTEDTCLFCSSSVPAPHYFETHEQTYHEPAKDNSNHQTCKKDFDKSELLTHSEAKPRMCTVCNRAFDQESSFKNHVCLIPEISMAAKDNTEHQMSSGENTEPYFCKICKRSFLKKQFLNHHVSVKHVDDRSFPCHFCPRICTAARYLKLHEQTHTCKEPHVCEICNAKFRCAVHLANHFKVHKLGYSGASQSSTSEYVCNLCHQVFLEPMQLKMHRKNHEKDRLLTCPHCRKIFLLDWELEIHVREKHGDEYILGM